MNPTIDAVLLAGWLFLSAVLTGMFVVSTVRHSGRLRAVRRTVRWRGDGE